MANWVDSQHSAFVRWCNMHLTAKGGPPVEDLATDFSNGVQLCKLTEQVTGQPVGKILEDPRYMEYYGNIQLALDLLKYNGVKLDMVGASDIVEGNLKLILGLVWQLILRFAVQGIEQDGVSSRDGLLLWCKFNAGIKGVNVTDFSKSWKDGRALCAIMSVFRPELLDFDETKDLSAMECITRAIAAAEKVGIPPLIDAEDIEQGPDDKSFILYMAYWFHTFSSFGEPIASKPGTRIQQFCNLWAVPLKMRQEYESRIKALLEAMDSQCNTWLASKFDTFDAISHEFTALKNYKLHRKREWAKEKSEIVQIYGNIRIKLGMYGGQQYTPAPELSLQYLNAMWLGVLEAENTHSKLLSAQLHTVKEGLRHEFANTANDAALQLYAVTIQVSALGGDLDSQLKEIIQQSDMLGKINAQLKDLEKLDAKCRSVGIEENDYTVYTFEELEYEYKLAEKSIKAKLAFVENQIVAQKSDIDLELLDEYETSFRFADQSAKNRLGEHEFKTALISLGCSYTTQEFAEIFATLKDKGTEYVTFHNYIKFLMSLHEQDQDQAVTLTQVQSSFREISNGKPFVTRQDLEAALLPEETISTLIEQMPSRDDGEYDFESYIKAFT